jgi:hypothetical protein
MRFRNPYISRLGLPRRFPAFGNLLFRPRSRGLARYVPQVDCPERGEKVWFDACVRCEKFAVWHSKDEISRCWHDFKALEERGYYDGTWDSHPENFDPETFVQLQDEKRNRERVLREMEAEKAELERLAAKLKETSRDGDYDEFPWLNDDYEDDEEDEEAAQTDENEDEHEY